MNASNFIIESSGIFSIITKGHIKSSIIEKIVDVNCDKRITIWQNNGYYFPCDRLPLTMGTDLFEMLKESNKWDILIIDSFVEWCNSKEIIEFLNYLKDAKEYKNKSIIIFFKAKRNDITFETGVSLNDFKVYKSTIEKVSNEIYLFNKTKDYSIIKLQDVNGNVLSLWKEEHFKLISLQSNKNDC